MPKVKIWPLPYNFFFLNMDKYRNSYLYALTYTSFLFRINCSRACGPFVNYETSWYVVPDTVSQLPKGVEKLLRALSSEAFAVSFFVITWLVLLLYIFTFLTLFFLCCNFILCFHVFSSLAMFYVIALAGAHKRVINELRHQLEMVGLILPPPPREGVCNWFRLLEV